jgi:hypothetical protein
MNSCFDIDGYSAHELSIFRRPDPQVGLLVTKCPTEAEDVIPVLKHDSNLWVICMMRDPRDVVVSRHGKRPDIYWTNLRLWKKAVDAALEESATDHRYILVRYEDLVTDPDSTQKYLEEHLPFLQHKVDFSQFHEIAKPSKDSVDAMRGVRPISSKSIGSWRQHKARLVAQIDLHGDIDSYLKKLGYENDEKWKQELTGITGENVGTFKPEFDNSTIRNKLYRRWKLWSRVTRHRLRLTRKATIERNN